jgi:hypothetical protein
MSPQGLPHLHAHSFESSAALALRLNSHSTTEQVPHPTSCGYFFLSLQFLAFLQINIHKWI